MRELESPGDRDEDELKKNGSRSQRQSNSLSEKSQLTMTFNQLALETFLSATFQVRPASLASFLLGEKRSSLKGRRG